MIDRLDHNRVIPDAMKALGQTHIYLSKTNLPKSLIILVFLRTSQINGCAYCIDMHARDLRAEGLSDEKLMLVPVWREAEHLFDAREKAALAWAETVTDVAVTHVPDEDYAAAAAVFDEKDLGDLTIAVALMNAYNRIGVPFRLKPAARA
jgi:AhpD family alkylhydroperoxidase